MSRYTRFCDIANRQGGAIKDGVLLGKAIRWYHSTATMTAIHYAKNNNKVPKSDGAKPVMNYPDKLPSDIDYQFYIQEAKNIIKAQVSIMRESQLEKKNSLVTLLN